MTKTVFPKQTPFFYLHQEDIIKQKGNLWFGKLYEYWVVEDEYSATKYTTKKQAEKHYESNLKINKAMKRDLQQQKRLK